MPDFKRLSRLLLCGLGSVGMGLSLGLSFPGTAQEIALPPPISKATEAERLRHQAEQEAYLTPDRYDLRRYPLTPEQEAHWRRNLWATALREPDFPELETALETILPLSFVTSLTETEQRILEMTLQVSYQFYGRSDRWRDRLSPQFEQIVTWSPHPRWVAMAISALGARENPDRQVWIDRVKTRLPALLKGDENDRLLLDLTLRDLAEPVLPAEAIEEWLEWQVAPGELQLLVFCGPDRSQLCQTLLKDGQGRWVSSTPDRDQRDQRDQRDLWSVPLAGRSLHGLPWYLSRDETPQGVYRLEGFIPQPDTDFFYAYGFFPLVNLFVPHEPGVERFVPGQPGTIDTLGEYQTLLPPRWRSVWAAQESYWAGQSGRSLFRIHGTGEATHFFVNADRFPQLNGWNPAIGCLSAREVYDAQGNFIEGDMPKILEALQRAQNATVSPKSPVRAVTGYVIVLNVADPKAIVQQVRENHRKS